MAYNSNKGKQHSGDVLYEGDPTDTQIDFENDSVALKTGGIQRLVTNNSHVSASVNLSASAFYGSGSGLVGIPTSALVAPGANTQVIYNNSGDLGANAGFTFTTSGQPRVSTTGHFSASLGVTGSSLRTLSTVIDSTHLSSSLNISGSKFYGDGSRLENAGIITSYTNASAGRIVTSVNGTTINGEAGLTYSSAKLSATGQVSASLGVTGSLLRTLATVIDSVHLSSSLNISGSKFYGDGSTLSGVGAGTMSNFTLRGDGGSTDSIADANTIDVAGGTGITTANARSVTTNTLTVNLDDTAVSAGDYTYSSFTVDAQGRLTDASSGAAPAITSYNNPGTSRVITSINGNTVNAQAGLTFNGTRLTAVGHISASLGITGSLIIATGSAPEIAVGRRSPVNTNMLYVSTHGNDNRVPLFITDTAENTILGVTGSGHVIIGGKGAPPTDAKLNVSGSDLDQLISLKADSIGQVFYVSASGELWNSGSATFKSPEPYLHLSSSVDAAGKAKIGLNSSNNILIQNNTSNKHIVFKTNDNGTTKEGLRLDGAVPEVVVNQDC